VLLLFQTNPAAGKFAELNVKDPDRAIDWLSFCFQKARAWCSRESPRRKSAREAMIRAWNIAWPGRTGSTDRAVFLAHTNLAHRSGKETYHASSRDLAEIAGCERRTASLATRRLGKAGLVRLDKRSSYGFANRYRLNSPTREVSDLVPLHNNPIYEGV